MLEHSRSEQRIGQPAWWARWRRAAAFVLMVWCGVVCLIVPSVFAGGGNRPDLSKSSALSEALTKLPPSLAAKIPGVGPVDERIRYVALAIDVARTAYQTASSSKRLGGLWKSPREGLQVSIEGNSEKLKDLLASTPSNLGEKDRALLASTDETEVARSNAELRELGRGMLNRNGVLGKYRAHLKELQSQVKLAPGDLNLVVEYYQVYREIARSLKEMCQEFAQGADGRYGSSIKVLMSRCDARVQELQGIASKYTGERAARYARLVTNTQKLKPVLEKALDILERQKAWARSKETELREDEELSEQSLKTAALSRDVQAAINDIVADFKEIADSLPPLIEFDVNSEELAAGLEALQPNRTSDNGASNVIR